MDNLRDCVAEKGVHSLGLCRLGRRELGTWIVVGVENPMRA
jgi:hypothetical protein